MQSIYLFFYLFLDLNYGLNVQTLIQKNPHLHAAISQFRNKNFRNFNDESITLAFHLLSFHDIKDLTIQRIPVFINTHAKHQPTRIRNNLAAILYGFFSYSLRGEITLQEAEISWFELVVKYPVLTTYRGRDRASLVRFILYAETLAMIVENFHKSNKGKKGLMLKVLALLENVGRKYTLGGKVGRETDIRENLLSVKELGNCHKVERSTKNKTKVSSPSPISSDDDVENEDDDDDDDEDINSEYSFDDVVKLGFNFGIEEVPFSPMIYEDFTTEAYHSRTLSRQPSSSSNCNKRQRRQ